jgi:tRNA (guanine26-N2/guanine27-N2)-dimethyltransferase
MTDMTTITEGSAIMNFPADQESTVFYNPVQVQNRDLSVLMISLYAERRAIRTAVKLKKKELRVEGITNQDELDANLKEYENTLNGKQMVAEQEQGDDNNDSGLTIMDALAASGLRSIRYWKEIAGVKHVTINDLDEAAVERAHSNLQNNNMQNVVCASNETRPKGVCVNHGDATHEMYMSRRPQQQQATGIQLKQLPMWDVIDLDPYGSAAPFLDGAVQAVESGGFLCITCTDMAALGGSHPETAYGRYASLPIQSARYLQEMALRILLHTISVSAARYGRTIRPVLSVGMAFYVRVFVEIYDDKKGVSDLSMNIGNVYQSTKCPTFVVLPHGQMGGKEGNVYQSIRLTPSHCEETGAPFKVGGPMWLGPLHDQQVIKSALDRLSSPDNTCPDMKLIATRARLQGLLTSVSEEIDTPLYYQLPDLCQTLHLSNPPQKAIMAALGNAGYQVSGYHKDPSAIKTNAPNSVVWDVLRQWVKKHPPAKIPAEGTPAALILAKEPSRPSMEFDFTIPKSMKKNSNVRRFPQNPEKHWGPKRMASGYKRKTDSENGEEEPPTPQVKRARTNGEDADTIAEEAK